MRVDQACTCPAPESTDPDACQGYVVPHGVDDPTGATKPECADAAALRTLPSCGKRCDHRAALLSSGHRACLIVATDADAQALFGFVRMLSPFLVAFALFSLHAAMREDEEVRRGLAFIFGGSTSSSRSCSTPTASRTRPSRSPSSSRARSSRPC